MRDPKFTTRRLMSVVAVAAVLTYLPLWVAGRKHHFRKLSRSHAGESFAVTRFAGIGPTHPRWLYHRAMMRKYQYAAEHPWWPVSSDPIKPEVLGEIP